MTTLLAPIIDAAYAPGEDEPWLERLLHATRPVLDAGLGVVGFFYDMGESSEVDPPLLRAPIMLGTPPGTREALERIAADAPRALLRTLYRLMPSCATMSDRLGLGERLVELPLHQSTLAPLGIADFLGVAATDASGAGCLIGAPLRRVTSLASLDERVLTAVAAHVTAGMRMRRQGGGAIPADDAHPVWAALVAGGWSVVDTFDRDGARFLLAKQDETRSASAPSGRRRELTAREHDIVARAAKGHANKRIAYELGLAPSTVAGHLARASAKLGVGSRVELMRAFVASAEPSSVTSSVASSVASSVKRAK